MGLIEEKTETCPSSAVERNFDDPCSKVGILYFVLDDKGNVVSCNVTAQEKLGCDDEELVGKKFLTLFSNGDRQKVLKSIKMCLQRGYVRDVETTLQALNGRRIDVSLNGLSTNGSDGQERSLRIYIKDVSALAKTKRERDFLLKTTALLREGDDSTQITGDALRGIGKVLDAHGIAFCSGTKEGIASIFEYWKSEEGGYHSDKRMFHDCTFEMWEQFLKACREAEAGYFTETGSFWADSVSDLITELKAQETKNLFDVLIEYESLAIIPTPAKDSSRGLLVMVHRIPGMWNGEDVVFVESVVPMLTHTKGKTEPQPARMNEQTLSMIDVPILGILLVKNGNVEYVNRWVEDFLGIPKEELVGKEYLHFIDPEYHEIASAPAQTPDSDEADRTEHEIIVLARDGRRRWVRCASMQVPVNGDSGVLWFWIDHENRHKWRHQLLQARKMEMLGMLAGGIVHEFNNLLACILGYSSLLSEEIPVDSSYRDDIQQINRAAEKAAELTSRLMAHAQGGEYVADELNVNQLVKEVAAILSRTLDKNISIRAELEQNLWSMKADASQIQQAVLQVALNARDAMLDGGKIIFHTRNITLTEDGPWKSLGGRPGRYVQVAINDTGAGMSGHVKERIFEPYFTTKDQTAGKGLGLSMVREIVENHGGFISVFSEKGEGTVFKMHLPVVDSETGRLPPLPVDKPTLGKETILFVDDEKVLRQTARKMLTRYGYKVMDAENAPEAVALYKKYTKRIDLIIMDIMLPGMEIDKVLTWMKKLNPEVRILASMELGTDKILKSRFDGKVTGFIQKPFQVRPLLRTVRSVLNA